MPPAISEDGTGSDASDDIDEVPAKVQPQNVNDEEADEDEDEDEEEYRVEKILTHDFAEDSTPIYKIKWEGYKKTSDQTWEPVENLANAHELLDAYHDKIGGVPVDTGPAKKKGAKGGKRSASMAKLKDSPAAEPSAKKRGGRKSVDAATNGKTALPDGDWEHHVLQVESIIEKDDSPPTGRGGKGKSTKSLVALLNWNNGKKTEHPMVSIRRKCPQKLLDYYEQHLVFKHSGTESDFDA